MLCLLLENEEVGWAAGTQLSLLISRDGTDNRIKLGWCLVVRELIQSGFRCWKSGTVLLQSLCHTCAQISAE